MVTCKDYLSCSEAARLMGVSRSSVQRYCEQGELRSHTTVGGHRRIDATDVSRWLRGRTNKSRKKKRKEVSDSRFSAQYTTDALLNGKLNRFSPLIEKAQLQQDSTSRIIDEILSPAMVHIGEMWACQKITYVDERRATTNVKLLLRQLLPTKMPVKGAMRAIGASLEGDHSDLASLALEIIALERGFDAFHVGTNLPARTLADIATQMEANLVWISYSHIENLEETVEQNQLICDLLPNQISLVVGGGALTPKIVDALDFDFYGSCCREFDDILHRISRPERESADRELRSTCP